MGLPLYVGSNAWSGGILPQRARLEHAPSGRAGQGPRGSDDGALVTGKSLDCTRTLN
jgi:hypothetical protein